MKKKFVQVMCCAMFCVTAATIGRMKNDTVWAAEYEYDELGRVTKVTYEDNSSITYEYDANGNILRVITAEGETETGNVPQVPQESTSASQSGSQTNNDNGQQNNEPEESAPQQNQNEQNMTDGQETVKEPDKADTTGEQNTAEDQNGKTGFFRKLWNGIVKFFQWLWSLIKSFFLWILSLIQKLLGIAFH